jgi:hypothetical protein
MDEVLVDLRDHLRILYGGLGLTNAVKKATDKDFPNLFAHLPWMQDGKILWSYLHEAGAETRILSARTNTWQPTAVGDKHLWIRKNLKPPPVETHIVQRHEKQNYARAYGHANILIDDWDLNINEWNAAGGIGILHRSAEETIEALVEIGFPRERR